VGALIQEFIRVGVYKRSQGRITRQVTFAALVIILATGLYRLKVTLSGSGLERSMPGFQFWFPGLLLFAWLWIAYRIVNIPSFADFLIAVEAEMNKVSWPTRTELFRASVVVLLTIFSLALILAGFDLFWAFVFRITQIHP
jgi:preprotein translocase subunit SecE